MSWLSLLRHDVWRETTVAPLAATPEVDLASDVSPAKSAST